MTSDLNIARIISRGACAFMIVWALMEGIRFWWDLLPKDLDNGVPRSWLPDRDYMMWRLGTVYGIYPNHKVGEEPNSYEALIRLAWRDRAQVFKFLLWRREMRLRRGR